MTSVLIVFLILLFCKHVLKLVALGDVEGKKLKDLKSKHQYFLRDVDH